MTSERELTPLEATIVAARDGGSELSDVLLAFEQSRVIVPSRTDLPDGNLRSLDPLVFDRDGTPMLAVFSHPDRIGEFVAEAPFALELFGADLVAVTPEGSGLILNPRDEIGLEVVPGLLDILRNRRQRERTES